MACDLFDFVHLFLLPSMLYRFIQAPKDLWGAALSLQRVENVRTCDGCRAFVFGVSVGVIVDTVKEDTHQTSDSYIRPKERLKSPV